MAIKKVHLIMRDGWEWSEVLEVHESKKNAENRLKEIEKEYKGDDDHRIISRDLISKFVKRGNQE